MGAITGIFYFSGKPAAAEAEAMINRMPHRLRAGIHSLTDGPIGLAQAVSQTVPQSSPEVATREGIRIAVDGRIDGLPAGANQSEHIIDLYLKHGELFAHYLLGDFAFALWNAKKRNLVLGRDCVGVKPLFYILKPDFVAFASEIKALWALPDAVKSPNESKLAEYLCFRNENKHETFFKDIYRVMPGHTITFSADGPPAERRYWNPMHLPEIHRASDKIYVEKYLDILKTAVSDRTRTDAVIGSALSGGLDSTSVAALSKAPHTFSIEYPEAPGSDESFFIQKAIEFIKPAYPHILKGHEECQIWQLDQFFQYEDEPFITITHGPTRGLYRRAAAEGVEVLLEGFAGDEVSSHSAQALGEAIRLGRWADARALLRLIKNYKSGALKKLKYIWKTGAEDLLRHAGIRIRREAERSLPYLRRLNSIASDELLQHLNLPGKYSQIRPRGIKDHTYIHSIYLFYPYLEAIERSAAYHGVDARFPYLDKRLIEYCVSLPFSQTLGKNIFGRYQLRRAMEGLLPTEVQWRVGKSSLDAHILYSAREASYKAYLGEISNSPAKDYIRKAAFKKMTKNDIVSLRLLWKEATLAEWLKRL